ncbi:TonB-dependent siderophore receptor [Ferrimonas aestuarii]|uniref:TonB-dependent siderophore receptor n=1 Tax=Ferrimonas aestuarii TaxID=2569539 RepID=A0A4U1BMT6_9GAMM|nr:TonB-dependent siderophore receptor [Ferrimonas aestuarii]TKB54983.1 TonB-dependent siderophore receptor [Ferrimonas aestuarii]
MKLSPIAMAMLMASAGVVAAEQDQYKDVERIEVTASGFNDYKNGSASGALRGDISLMDTPQSVAVIPEIVIDEQLATNLGKVLTNDSSVTAGSEKWNRQQFSLRGFPLNTGTGYLKDGQQVWSHYMHPVEILERVEVVKGPSSMLYGQSAPGGLINMVTKKPTVERFAEVAADFDDQGSMRYQLDVGGALNEEGTLRGRTVLVKQDEKMWREYQNGEQNERDRFLGSVQLEGDISDWATINVHYDRTEDEAGIDVGGWLDADGNLIGGEDQVWDQPWAKIDVTAENYGFDASFFLADNLTLKTGYNHQKFERHRFDSAAQYKTYDAQTGTYDIKPFDRHDDWQLKTFYADFTAELSTGEIEHQVLFGANGLDYSYTQLREKGATQTVTNGSPVAAPDLDYNTATPYEGTPYLYYGVYLQDLITINEQWKVLVGVRYDELDKDTDNSSDDSDSVLPRFGVIYQPIDNVSIYANYSESFEPQGQVNNEDDRNDGMDLDPVTAKAYELGAKAELFNGHLMLTGAYFDITKEDIILTHKIDDPNYTDETRQDGEQQHKGFELSAQGRATDSLFVSASAMYLDAEYTKHTSLQGNRPIDAPEWSANAWTRYELNDDLALNLGAIYVGERFADTANTITKDGYVRFDLGASYKLPTKHADIDIRFNVENLFDEDYLGGGDYDEVAIGEDRNFNLSITAAF